MLIKILIVITSQILILNYGQEISLLLTYFTVSLSNLLKL